MKASEALDAVGDALIADLKNPKRRVGLVVTMATSAVCARAGMRLLPSVMFSVAAGYGAERMYVVISDVHKAAVMTQDRLALAGSDATADAA